MYQTKVSIVIPIYNVELYLRQCLDSVVNQTMEEIEIICVNDCSTDSSLKIVQEYAQKDFRIKIIDKGINEGPGVSRNVGLLNSIGKYILFLDPDDYITTDSCEKLYDKIEADKSDAVYFNANKFIDGENNFSLYKKYKKIFSKIGYNQTFYARDFYPFLANQTREAWYKFYNRDFLEKHSIKFSEHRLCEDSLFRLSFLLANPKLSILDEPLYFYRKRKDALTQTDGSKSDMIFDVNEKCINIIIKSDLSKDEKLAFIKAQIKWVILWIYRENYDKRTLLENRTKVKKLYKEIFKYFSIQDFQNKKMPIQFWEDLTFVGNKYFSVYYDYSNGYRIKLLFLNILIRF